MWIKRTKNATPSLLVSGESGHFVLWLVRCARWNQSVRPHDRRNLAEIMVCQYRNGGLVEFRVRSLIEVASPVTYRSGESGHFVLWLVRCARWNQSVRPNDRRNLAGIWRK